MKPLCCCGVQGEQATTEFLLGVFFGAEGFLFHANAHAGSEALDGFGEIDVFVEFDKFEHTTASTTPETFEDLPGGIDIKGCRFLLVKRAAGFVGGSRPLQGEIARDDIDDVIGLGNLLEEVFGDHGKME